jgi:SAM-dependent methyltransferase
MSDFWEDLYGQRTRIWSGRPNQALVDVAADLEPGRALDLGSGEGGDSFWLAERGWTVTGLDISATALTRAAAEAESRGIEEGRIRWLEQDLAVWTPADDERYDLVSACFLHAPAELDFPREEVLRRAAATVAPGGSLLVVGHAAFPPWSNHSDADAESHDADKHQHGDGHQHRSGDGDGHQHGSGDGSGQGAGHAHPDVDLPTPDEVAAFLALPAAEWSTVVSETRARQAVGPDGQEAELFDAVLLMRRVGARGD